ncbi:sigma factor regulator N-terminal domain-containing protein [Levilactobacillus cerevisiae]|uniref:sigma factor regulator N-terminal domain-containing protein n=1 Tax=Levilactobacillus cerevisiae TaxID=1704076 RepID=UPI000F79C39F|nr:sigma factor regulator N-terminal domain-containing protein [Levilactobacillus cerevisiae]
MNEGQQFEKLARRVKWRRWLITIGLIVAVVIGLGAAFIQMTRVKSQAASDEANRSFELVNTVLSPNIQISDQYLQNSDFFGGTLVSHRYKDIDGARIAWSENRAPYTWMLGSNANAFNTTDTTTTAAYDRDTQQKIPLFYNVNVAKPEVKRAQEVRQVVRQKNYRAEVALTFKQPLTLKQIQAKLPAGVHANWYWAGVSGKADATVMDNNFVGIQADGNHQPTTATYKWFRKEVRSVPSGMMTFNNFNVMACANRFIKRYPQLNEAKFSGVIVTGNSEAFKPLVQANWLDASSVGYFQPRTGIK